MEKVPRPVRNNNPLDIESGQGWLGLMPEGQMSPEQKAESRFAVFKSPVWGFRAGAMLLRNYHRVHGLSTLEELVFRLAPPVDNDTGAYLNAMMTLTGFPARYPQDLENPKTLAMLLRAFATQEAGEFEPYWTDEQIEHAVAMLFGQEPKKGAMV